MERFVLIVSDPSRGRHKQTQIKKYIRENLGSRQDIKDLWDSLTVKKNKEKLVLKSGLGKKAESLIEDSGSFIEKIKESKEISNQKKNFLLVAFYRFVLSAKSSGLTSFIRDNIKESLEKMDREVLIALLKVNIKSHLINESGRIIFLMAEKGYKIPFNLFDKEVDWFCGRHKDLLRCLNIINESNKTQKEKKSLMEQAKTELLIPHLTYKSFKEKLQSFLQNNGLSTNLQEGEYIEPPKGYDGKEVFDGSHCEALGEEAVEEVMEIQIPVMECIGTQDPIKEDGQESQMVLSEESNHAFESIKRAVDLIKDAIENDFPDMETSFSEDYMEESAPEYGAEESNRKSDVEEIVPISVVRESTSLRDSVESEYVEGVDDAHDSRVENEAFVSEYAGCVDSCESGNGKPFLDKDSSKEEVSDGLDGLGQKRARQVEGFSFIPEPEAVRKLSAQEIYLASHSVASAGKRDEDEVFQCVEELDSPRSRNVALADTETGFREDEPFMSRDLEDFYVRRLVDVKRTKDVSLEGERRY